MNWNFVWLSGLLIIITRSLYVIGFWMNYVKYAEKYPENGREYTFSKKNYWSYTWKNLVIMSLGFLNMYISIVLSVYSMFLFGYYISVVIKRTAKEPYQKIYRAVRWSIYLSNPVLIYLALSPFDPGLPQIVSQILSLPFLITVIKIIPIILGIVLYLYPGRKFGQLSLKKMYRYYNSPILGLVSAYPKIRAGILIFVIAVPSIFFIGLLALGYPRKEHYMLEMPDGVHLATDVYYTSLKGKNPAPVLLVRSPYGLREFVPEVYTSRFTAMGFHVVLQDSRGTFGSEGSLDTLLFAPDAWDGYYTIEWIRNQSWCNGKIVSEGTSAMAIISYFYAGLAPKGLVAQSLKLGTPDLTLDAILEGALHEHLMNYWSEFTAGERWRNQLGYVYKAMNNPANLNNTAFPLVTLAEGPNRYENVNVSALHVGGWFDIFLGGTVRGYRGYNELGTENARGKQKLIIGPWTHAMWITTQQGDLNFPTNSIGTSFINEWEEDIFNYAVFGIEKPGMWNKRVVYYLMGAIGEPNVAANYWKFAEDWPLPYRYTEWYPGISADQTTKLLLNGTFPTIPKNFSYLYNPWFPIPTIGGANLFTNPVGPVDQRSAETYADGTPRKDFVQFETEILSSPVTVEGDMKMILYITSNCTDTDFMVKLCDVYPDGRKILLRDAALTARYRHINFTSVGVPQNYSQILMQPEKEYELIIELGPIAYQFNKGHKISITVSSSNYPRFALNTNTGEFIPQHYANAVIANNTVITGVNKTRLLLPVL